MKSLFKKLQITTNKQFEMVDFTGNLQKTVLESGIQNGIAVVFCPHTTASVRLNHNEPLLMQDLMKTLYKLVPIDTSYGHDLFEVRQNIAPNERSNGHAHIKAFLLGSSETLIIEKGNLLIGPRQSIFFVEMDGGRSREVSVKIIGD